MSSLYKIIAIIAIGALLLLLLIISFVGFADPEMRFNPFGRYADQKILERGYDLSQKLENYYDSHGDYPDLNTFVQIFGNNTGFTYTGGFRSYVLRSGFLYGRPTNTKVGHTYLTYRRDWSPNEYQYQITSCDTGKRCVLGSEPRDSSYVFTAQPKSIVYNGSTSFQPYSNGTHFSIPISPTTRLEFITRAFWVRYLYHGGSDSSIPPTYLGTYPTTSTQYTDFRYDPRYLTLTTATTTFPGGYAETAIFTPTGVAGYITFEYTEKLCFPLCSESEKRSYEIELYNSSYNAPKE